MIECLPTEASAQIGLKIDERLKKEIDGRLKKVIILSNILSEKRLPIQAFKHSSIIYKVEKIHHM